MKYDVFICYSKHDTDVAQMVRNELGRYGITSFYDAMLLSIGGDYAAEITEVIRESSWVLYLHSDYSIQSNWIRKELEYAISRNISIIPVNISGFRSDDSAIRKLLFDRVWLEFDRYAVDSDKRFEKVINEILRIVSPTSVQGDRIGGISQRREQGILPESGKRAEQTASDNVKKHSVQFKKYWGLVVSLVVFSVSFIFLSKDNINVGVLLVLLSVFVFLAWLIILLVDAFCEAEFTIKLHNTDSRRKLILRIDGKEDGQLEPLGLREITRRRGEHVISIQTEDTSSEVVVMNQIFSGKTNGQIITIELPQNQMSANKTKFLKYRCFIAGSTSIPNERNAARAVLSILYNQYEKYDFYITAHTFEDFKNKHKIDGHQFEYDTFIKQKADCTIFIICNHVGDKTLNEYRIAIDTLEKTESKRPAIFVYNDISNVNNIMQQDPSVLEFRKLVNSQSAYWRDYNGIDMLMLKIKDDISAELTDVLEMRPSIKRD